MSSARRVIFAVAAIGCVVLTFSLAQRFLTVTPAEPTPFTESFHLSPTASLESASTLKFSSIPLAHTNLDFQYFGSPSPDHYLTEQNGGGAAILDFDCDGTKDLFLSNGAVFTESIKSLNHSNHIYRGEGDFHFSNVTKTAGLTHFNFGQGCATADYDNDGFPDIFVAAYGKSSLWHNNGDGTFTELAAVSGIDHTGFATSAAFADLDGDGNLDLYVVNYLEWTPDNTPRDRVQSPMDFHGQTDLLYHNTGAGQFSEVGSDAGIAIADDGKGLAIAIIDMNDDQRLDIYVANDTRRNFYFQNLGDMRFHEVGVTTGAAVSQDGSIGSSMGIAVSDYNHDGRPDLFITNFAEELVDVLMNLGDAGFMATNTELGIDSVSRPVLNFGIVSADFDLDLWPDLFFANGHLWDETSVGGQYRMYPSLMKNEQGRRFVDVAKTAGEYFNHKWLGRSTAMGDLDNDGDVDLVVSHLINPPALLRNDSVRQGQSQRIMFIGTTSCRQPLGCRVDVELKDGTAQIMLIPSGGSFQASHDSILVVPTGEAGLINAISICWPDGTMEMWKEFHNAETIQLIEGTGQRAANPHRP
jgi:hypothetical protein